MLVGCARPHRNALLDMNLFLEGGLLPIVIFWRMEIVNNFVDTLLKQMFLVWNFFRVNLFLFHNNSWCNQQKLFYFSHYIEQRNVCFVTACISLGSNSLDSFEIICSVEVSMGYAVIRLFYWLFDVFWHNSIEGSEYLNISSVIFPVGSISA